MAKKDPIKEQRKELETRKNAFIDEYNNLCIKYSLKISTRLGLEVWDPISEANKEFAKQTEDKKKEVK